MRRVFTAPAHYALRVVPRLRPRAVLLGSVRALSTEGGGGGENSIFVEDVTPRDGLQNEKAVLTTESKLELVERIVTTAPASVEITSFVRADLIPALAGSRRRHALRWAGAQHAWVRDTTRPRRRARHSLRANLGDRVTLEGQCQPLRRGRFGGLVRGHQHGEE
eukprot:COSAG02_NODE_2959_length_7660_cov_1.967465_3_plen_164_part_00